jgi:hypothetical protein
LNNPKTTKIKLKCKAQQKKIKSTKCIAKEVFLWNSQQNEALENKMKHLVLVKFTIQHDIKIIMTPSILVKFTTN